MARRELDLRDLRRDPWSCFIGGTADLAERQEGRRGRAAWARANLLDSVDAAHRDFQYFLLEPGVLPRNVAPRRSGVFGRALEFRLAKRIPCGFSNTLSVLSASVCCGLVTGSVREGVPVRANVLCFAHCARCLSCCGAGLFLGE